MAPTPPPTVDDRDEDTDFNALFDPTQELDVSNPEKWLGEDRMKHADDAENFSDIDDDDLADEEEPSQSRELESLKTTDPGVKTAETSFDQQEDPDDFIGLFGGDDLEDGTGTARSMADADIDDLFMDTADDGADKAEAQENMQQQILSIEQRASEAMEVDEALSAQELEQMRLFQMSKDHLQGLNTDDPEVNTSEELAELIQQYIPDFEQGKTMKFTELLPSIKAYFVGKQPLKPPKAVLPTKISLEIAKDHEKDFKLLAGGRKRNWEDSSNAGFIIIAREEGYAKDEDEDVEEESDYENGQIAGFSWQDFQIVCEDWDQASIDGSEPHNDPADAMDMDLDDAEEWEQGRPAKRRKLEPLSSSVLNSIPRFEFPSLHDPAKATARIAKRVVLDLNDPMLLVNEIRSEENDTQQNAAATDRGDRRTQRLAARYNISNDQEYELLSAQQQSKSRSTLGSLAVSHSLPALRLQWPYYKTKLEKQESRSFHRPRSQFPKMEHILFKPTKIVKRKNVKGKDATEVFQSTADLSLADNAHTLLLEYSEQHPTMMSNFGMNSRVINYYRKVDPDDDFRPKGGIGEAQVLQPQDVSPLTQFGDIDPGETTPAIYNGMFKAPVFEQESRPTDFVLIRNATGVDGSNWYLRNIEYMRVVGQQFPSVEVPGPNARKVTTAAKNRLKMVSYRLLKRSKTHTITVSKVTPHVLDPSGAPSNDMQNRQKLKEFLQFNKEHKEWELKPGDVLPESNAIRDLVKPEDVCLLEAMQVGTQQLEDAGFGSNTGAINEDEQSDDEGAGDDGQNLEQLLVPWQTTKNFIAAANNKAMLRLHGEGDPTKRGEGFSMLKISMKGGFKAEGEAVQEKIDAATLKELGGHSYNVAKQAESYNRSVRQIWDRQKQSLSSAQEPELEDNDEEEEQEEEPVLTSQMDGPDVQTMRQPQATSFGFGRDNESVSQFSHLSRNSQNNYGSILKINRRVKDSTGKEEQVTEIVRDPRVIRQYLKLRRLRDSENIDLSDLSKLDQNDPEVRRRIATELARLERNKERRIGREKQRGGTNADSPGSPSATPAADGDTLVPKKGKGNPGGTVRKCANCGQIGHIKTNKKLCPLLNGQMKQDTDFAGQDFTMSTAQL